MKLLYNIFLVTICCSFQMQSAGLGNGLGHQAESQPGLWQCMLEPVKQQLYKRWFSAIRHENLVLIHMLKSLVDINAAETDFNNDTALMIAAYWDNDATVQLLLAMPGINVNATNLSGSTALMKAAYSGTENIVKLLVNTPGLNINAQDRHGSTAFLHAIDQNFQNIIDILLHTPAIVVNPHGRNILIWAAADNRVNIIKYFLQIPEIDINYQDRYGKTALMAAAQAGHEASVKTLLAAPAINVNIQDKRGMNVLMIAICYIHMPIIKLLLGTPINFYAQDEHGKTVLNQLDAAQPGYKRTAYNIKKLIENKISKLTDAAFMAVSSYAKASADATHNLDQLKKILAQISIDKITDATGNTLLDTAFEVNQPAIIIFLLQNAKDPQELLSRFPFEVINPTSEIFEYMLDLAYACPSKSGPSIKRSAGLNFIDPEKSEIIKFCHVCSAKTDTLCARCKKVYYCSQKCQKADWNIHKHLCAVRAKMGVTKEQNEACSTFSLIQ